MNRVLELLRALAGKIVVPVMEKRLARFESLLPQARQTQRALMLEKIRRAESSQFGRDHHFSAIHSLADFRRNIPIAQYDYYWPYIKRVTEGDVTAMFPAGEKLLMYTLSSGTTDDPKLIPVNNTWMREYRRGWSIWGVKAFLAHPKLFYSKLAGIAGNWDMRRTPTNIACGMASGLSARMQNPLLKMVYSVPPDVYSIDDVSAKYYAALRLSVPDPVGLFMTATPTTVLNFAQLADQHKETLIRDVRDGTISQEFDIPSGTRQQLARLARAPRPDRARELEAIVERTGHLYPKDFWDLSLVACWLGGTVGAYARHITEYYGQTPQRDIGLLCSEGRFTIPLEDGTPAGALEISSHYYEFVPESEIDSKQPTVLECHELEEGKSYYLLLTTSSGLYRYDIQDVLRCVGRIGETPILEFLHKGQRFSDMEGEKLTEFHFVKAVSEIAGAMELPIAGFTAVPHRPADWTGPNNGGQAPYYTLLVEEQEMTDRARSLVFLEKVDRWLCDHNVMYQGKRLDRYLGPLRLRRVPRGTWNRFDRGEIQRRGVSEDHYKHPCLVLDPAFLDRFEIIEDVFPATDPMRNART